MALIVAAAVTVLVTPLAAGLARRTGVVDRPGALKVQQQPVPYLGGLALLAGISAALAPTVPRLLVPLALALLLGLADDVADLSPQLRMVGEVGVGIAAVVALPDRPGLAAGIGLVVVVVALLNAVNLLDGLDGLAASVAALGALGFAVVLHGPSRGAALALAGALFGFLLWNRPPARIYLGDAGSYLVGTTLAVLFALTATEHGTGAPASGALLFIAVPVADTTVAIVRRWRAGQPLWRGDRGHVYDQLVDRGSTTGRATVACAVAQAVLVAAGLGVGALTDEAALVVVALVIVGVGLAALRTFTTPAASAT